MSFDWLPLYIYSSFYFFFSPARMTGAIAKPGYEELWLIRFIGRLSIILGCYRIAWDCKFELWLWGEDVTSPLSFFILDWVKLRFGGLFNEIVLFGDALVVFGCTNRLFPWISFCYYSIIFLCFYSAIFFLFSTWSAISAFASFIWLSLLSFIFLFPDICCYRKSLTLLLDSAMDYRSH